MITKHNIAVLQRAQTRFHRCKEGEHCIEMISIKEVNGCVSFGYALGSFNRYVYIEHLYGAEFHRRRCVLGVKANGFTWLPQVEKSDA